MRHFISLSLVFFSLTIFAQKKNINAAWRAFTDYQSTLNDKPELKYLLKAKESIDLAYQSPDTKEDSRTLTYQSQIYYELYKFYDKNPDPTIPSIQFLNTANQSFQTLKEKHPKVAATPELNNLGIFLLNSTNEQAIKSFNSKSYKDATDLFLQHYNLQNALFSNKPDTSGLFNAFVCAYKANIPEKVESISTMLIQNNFANIKTYQLLYSYYQHNKDTMNQLKTLVTARKKYPDDMNLLNLETDYFISTKNYPKAISNLEQIIQKDSTNAMLLMTLGNLYDNLANQRMNTKQYNDSTEKLFNKTELYYMRAINHKNKLDNENAFTLLYSVGAYYTNYGLFYYNRKMTELKITEMSQKQKPVEEKRKEYNQKALPYLKEAEAIKPDDNTIITALYRVYALIGDTKNADIYKNKMLKK